MDWFLFWLSFFFGWFCDWNSMGCGSGDWMVVGRCWLDLQQTGMNTNKEEREREKLIKYCIQNYSNRIYLHSYYSILYIYKGLERLMHVFFVLYCVNFFTFCILQWLIQLLYVSRMTNQIQLKWPYFLSSIYSKGHKAVCGLKVSRKIKSRLTLEDRVRCFY